MRVSDKQLKTLDPNDWSSSESSPDIIEDLACDLEDARAEIEHLEESRTLWVERSDMLESENAMARELLAEARSMIDGTEYATDLIEIDAFLEG